MHDDDGGGENNPRRCGRDANGNAGRVDCGMIPRRSEGIKGSLSHCMTIEVPRMRALFYSRMTRVCAYTYICASCIRALRAMRRKLPWTPLTIHVCSTFVQTWMCEETLGALNINTGDT